MNHVKKMLCCSSVVVLVLFSSCTNSEVTNEEKVTIETRDSVSRTVADVKDKLDKQTQAVETSIEKMDEEFKK